MKQPPVRCLHALRLRHPRFQGVVKPATFVIPAGGLVPLLAIAVSLFILGGATWPQLLWGAAALAVGAALFMANDRFGGGAGRWKRDTRVHYRVDHMGDEGAGRRNSRADVSE